MPQNRSNAPRRPSRRQMARRREARRRAWLTGIVCCLALLAAVAVGLLLTRLPVSQAAADQNDVPQTTAEPPVTDAAAPPAEEPTPPPLSEEEQRIQGVLATVQANCTKDAPQITDPATWNERGLALMNQLTSDPYYISEGINITEKPGCPYLIAVNRAASTVTVYTLDAEGNYTVPYMAMVCSGGEDTPTGFFATIINYDWRELYGPCYGQYATRIWESYLFHSVPYYTQHKDDLEYDQYNQLGTPASLGCIRLMVVDVKWIYDNCPIGTRVIIYDNAEDPGPMGKPGTIYTDPANADMRGWDPTDPDPANPWDDAFLTGTTIRSEAAWAEYNAAQADGRWNGSLNPADLQGWSTDSSVEGTRG